MRRVAVLIATVGGAGFSPVAPGTAGSLVAIAIYFLTRHWPPAWQIGLLAAVTVIGTWAANEAVAHFGREDPGEVVVDEVAGQLLTLLLLNVGLLGAALGFLVFRALDIVKPWPARRLEDLPGGLGIMADDLMAGVFGWVLMRVAILVVPWSW